MTKQELERLTQAKLASRQLALFSPRQRENGLRAMALRLAEGAQAVLDANRADLEQAKMDGMAEKRLGILALRRQDVEEMAGSMRRMAAWEDPVDRLLESVEKPGGLRREKRLVPLGVVAVVYEARPTVVCDTAALCLRTGNALVLRGSRHSRRTDEALAALLHRGLVDAGIPEQVLVLLSEGGYECTRQLSQMERLVDLLLVRGGYEVLEELRRAATVPVLGAGPGNCHIYIDRTAKPELVERVVWNSKVPRPLACNAVETLLVQRDWAGQYLTALLDQLVGAGIGLRGCPLVCALYSGAQPAAQADWEREYFAPVLAVKMVADVDEAIDHINTNRTPHTEAILTEDVENARRFFRLVEANVVCHNASTRMTDGVEFDLGGEMGISTQKYPCGGPIGPLHLMQQKYYLFGQGTVR